MLNFVEKAFIYDWSSDLTENDTTLIRIFCLNETGETVILNVADCLFYIYLELPATHTWDRPNLGLIKQYITEKKSAPAKVAHCERKKLYYASAKRYAYLKVYFEKHELIREVSYLFNKYIVINGIGRVFIKTHEHIANPFLQFTCQRNIPMCGWIEFDRDSKKIQYDLSANNIRPLRSPEEQVLPEPCVMSFDIEVYSSNANTMPKAAREADCIFQISCVFKGNNNDAIYLLSLGTPTESVVKKDYVDAFVLSFNSEQKMLLEFFNLIHRYNPHVIIGYNILVFDLPYIIDRCRLLRISPSLYKIGMIDGKECQERREESTTTSGLQIFRYIDADGRIWIDLLSYARRECKFDNYKLDTVASHFLNYTKDDFKVSEIFRAYEAGVLQNKTLRGSMDEGVLELVQQNNDLNGFCGKYCLKDSVLVYDLFKVLDIWVGITEMANICNVPISYIYTKGQQIKIYSQVYKYCYDEIVVETDAYKSNKTDNYQGATVMNPDPNLYNYIVPFDFKSLYPSLIIAYNIDYSTLVIDNTIPDSSCNVIEWKEHMFCECCGIPDTSHKDFACANYRYRFMKPTHLKGVIPSIIENLLNQRAQTRLQMESLPKDNILQNILNKRQLAYKLASNSVRGDTPIPCRVNGLFKYLTIEELSNQNWVSEGNGQELSKPFDNIEVWSDIGYTKVNYVMRHSMTTPLKRISTHTGCVDCTEDHSLLTEDGREIRPRDIGIGHTLMHRETPLLCDTPRKQEYVTITYDAIMNHPLDYTWTNIPEEFNINTLTSELAFGWGMFFSEGTCGTYGNLGGKKSSWIIYNQDLELLKKTCDLYNKNISSNDFAVSHHKYTSTVYHLYVRGSKLEEFCGYYRDLFYDQRRMKRIPAIILNAPYPIRLAFFIGYYAGDGSHTLKTGVVILNKGAIGSAGLAYLARSLGYVISISIPKKDDDIYRIQCGSYLRNKNATAVKIITNSTIPPEIVLHYDHSEYVYDIETVNHHFAAGVGNMIVHNSMYGGMGVTKGMLPFMIGAMCITAMGRKNLATAQQALANYYEANVIYSDSVSADTPIMIRYANGSIDIKTVSNIPNTIDWDDYSYFKSDEPGRFQKEQQIPLLGLETWTSSGWQKIIRVIRHKTKKRMYRINTSVGCVDVTEDHSLLGLNRELLKPKDVSIGRELYHSFPTEFHSTPILYECKPITEEEAYVFGFFMSDGSCEDYVCPSGKKCFWAIDNKSMNYLNQLLDYLNKIEPNFDFKILDTLKSSRVYKLVATGRIMLLTRKYRALLYNGHSKIVPYCILNSDINIRRAFFNGLYTADKYKSSEVFRINISQKNKISTQGLYYLLTSLGYDPINVSLQQDNPSIYTLSNEHTQIRKPLKAIKKIIELPSTTLDEYVYDIETEDGTFLAGIGSMIVKNTDSCYVQFPDVNPENLYDHASEVEKSINSRNLFVSPIYLEFENTVYNPFLILTKKRYLYRNVKEDGTTPPKIGSKGVLLSRRDCSGFARDLYRDITELIFDRKSFEDISAFLLQSFISCSSGSVDKSKFVITKSVKNQNEYKVRELPTDPLKRKQRLLDLCCQNEEDYLLRSLPAQVQLAHKLRSRGVRVDSGQRLEYVITKQGGIKAKIFDKIEDVEYQQRFSSILTIEYLYYIEKTINPIDQVLGAVFKKIKYTKNLYTSFLRKYSMLQELRLLFAQKLKFHTE